MLQANSFMPKSKANPVAHFWNFHSKS